MKRLLIILFIAVVALTTAHAQQPAQNGRKFSPEAFDREMEQYITEQAHLTREETARFFPLFREMHQKQRAIMGRNHRRHSEKPTDEQSCLQYIQERDKAELDLKLIQQDYHKRFLEVLSASKVYDIIRAEDSFHRRQLRQMAPGKRK